MLKLNPGYNNDNKDTDAEYDRENNTFQNQPEDREKIVSQLGALWETENIIYAVAV